MASQHNLNHGRLSFFRHYVVVSCSIHLCCWKGIDVNTKRAILAGVKLVREKKKKKEKKGWVKKKEKKKTVRRKK